MEVDPVVGVPGETVTLTGSGGYIRCGSSYNESERMFQLHFDGTPSTEIMCYANHCETKLTVPVDAEAGEHAIEVEGGSQVIFTIKTP
jgi:hypothetical protein